MDAKFLEDPDMEDIPQTPEAYRDGLYAEIRHIRRTAENIFWVFLIFAVILALTAGWAISRFLG